MSEPSFTNQTGQMVQTKKIIGVIGYGRFGKFLSQLLSENVSAETTEVVVFSRREISAQEKNIRFLPMINIGEADVIIPCVSISSFEEVMSQIAPHIKQSCIIIDVCSVKIFPIEVMQRVLPSTVSIIGSHPVFGPDSFEKNGGTHNLPIVLTKVRCDEVTYQKVKDFCETLKLKILEMSAEEHDRYAAYSQAYAFLIGKIGQRMNIQPTPIDTMWYRLLQEERHAIEHDSEQLFFDIQGKNPFAKKMRNQFEHEIQTLFKEMKNKE